MLFSGLLEGCVTISASPGLKVTSVMTGYPLPFFWEGVHSNKQEYSKNGHRPKHPTKLA